MKSNMLFSVQGRPFFPLGGQAHNSSGYSLQEAERAFEAVAAMHGNSVAIPITWEQVEPQEGSFDFSMVDNLVERCRKADIHLVILWFATWKNGTMKYAPAWVKQDRQRFRRVRDCDGLELTVLSSHCAENQRADGDAFCRLVQHVRDIDGDTQTVIGFQIENEPGIIGRAPRDFGPEATAEYESPVPEDLLDNLEAMGQGRAYEIWQACGGKKGQDWFGTFGNRGHAFLTAYSIAGYIDGIAQRAKAIYDLPMYVNVWLGMDGLGYTTPGTEHPAGGGTALNLDIWKAATRFIDTLAPDNYLQAKRDFLAVCEAFARPDNPLYTPESGRGGSNSRLIFHAIANYGCSGHHIFGVEDILLPDGSVRPDSQELVGSYRALAAAQPLLTQYIGTGRIYAIDQEEDATAQYIHLDGYLAIVTFLPHTHNDYHHRDPDAPAERGRGLIFQTGADEFYVLGAGFSVRLQKCAPLLEDVPPYYAAYQDRQINYLVCEEGHFDAEGQWVTDRLRTGDESDFGIWAESDVGVVKVVICP